jgi:dihydrolipoamide dehydrogenase
MNEHPYDFDTCVIGSGPAGFAAVMRCWDFGQRVCLIEKSELGGAGIHNGALSSKTLWELSRDYRRAVSLDRGFTSQGVRVDYARVCGVVQNAVQEKVGQLRRQLDDLSEPKGEDRGSITRVEGTAHFVDPHTVRVEAPDPGQSRDISAANFIVATGSRPRQLPSIEVDGQRILTSDHVMQLPEFPKSMVILGAGVVGCEFATVFANYGQTKVYMIDRQDRILPFEDEDIARVCATNLESRGVTVHHRAKLVDMRRIGDEVEYTIEHQTGGRETIRVDYALISIGRVPNTETLGLADIGVELNERGYIVDDDTQSSVPHIYAVGDVTFDIALVNVGEIEGRHAAERICGAKDGVLSYENLSTIMFLDPEVAAIGLNELQAQKRRIPYRVAVYDYALVNRAVAMRATEGFVKLLTTDDDEMCILGMRALGVHASTTLEAISLMMRRQTSARELAELLHPHPAITEGLQDCVRMLTGSSIYKPQVFKSHLRLSRVSYAENGEAQESSAS